MLIWTRVQIRLFRLACTHGAERRPDPRGPHSGDRPRAETGPRLARHDQEHRDRWRRRDRWRHADDSRLPAEGHNQRRRHARGGLCPRRRARGDRVRQHVGRPARRARHEAAWWPSATASRRVERLPANARDRRCLRQGWCRQVVTDRQPRDRLPADGPRGRRDRRRHLWLLDSRHARHPSAPGDRRQDDRAARRARAEDDLDRLLHGGGRRRSVAWPDAAQGDAAVPVRRPLGRARCAADRHAARHRRRRHLARRSRAECRGRGDHHPAGGGTACRRACRCGFRAREHARGRGDREHVVPRLPLLWRA